MPVARPRCASCSERRARTSWHGIPSITGGAGNDVLIGDEHANSLSGGAGDDRVEGGSGADALNGDAGADLLLGGDGDDSLSGDSYASETGCDVLDGGAGDDRLDLSAADDDMISIAGPTYDPLDDGRRDVAGAARESTPRSTSGPTTSRAAARLSTPAASALPDGLFVCPCRGFA